MAKLSSTIVYGNLDVTGNLTINGQMVGEGGSSGTGERLDNLESASLTATLNITDLQNSLSALQNAFNGYQGPLELQATSTHIQWRKAGTTTWTNLISLAAITPSIDPLKAQLDEFKSGVITEFTALEKSLISKLNVGITSSEIDTIIANALK